MCIRDSDIRFALDREQEAGTLCSLLDSGELPLRVTHNDTKLNNVLFDRLTRKALCVLCLLYTSQPATPSANGRDAAASEMMFVMEPIFRKLWLTRAV